MLSINTKCVISREKNEILVYLFISFERFHLTGKGKIGL